MITKLSMIFTKIKHRFLKTAENFEKSLQYLGFLKTVLPPIPLCRVLCFSKFVVQTHVVYDFIWCLNLYGRFLHNKRRNF